MASPQVHPRPGELLYSRAVTLPSLPGAPVVAQDEALTSANPVHQVTEAAGHRHDRVFEPHSMSPRSYGPWVNGRGLK
jgi:hypothetical protein